ncbi:MAG: hypothetical protein LBB47_04025, partial [Spirochaetaceae bacterium]|nr:hypothetical protein [Spirochaetaceae bacterium]
AISKRTGFTNKIIETLSQNRGEAGENLSAEFNSFIKNTSAGEIVSSLKKSGFISGEIIADALAAKLRNLKTENIELFTTVMDAKIKNLFPNLDFSFIKTKLLPHISGALKQFLNSEYGSNRLLKKINAAIDSFAAKNISDTIDLTKIPLNVNETGVKDFMLRHRTDISGLNAGGFFVGAAAALPWMRITDRVKARRVNGVYRILQNDVLYAKAADAVQNLVSRNLDTILGGSVFEIAKNELDVLSPPQVNSMVHDFMGTQLKPINIIGAVLGGLAGALTALVTMFLKLPASFSWALSAAYGLVFALAGIGTNWIAVKMLFHPYKRIAGLNFPPFIGVAALKQAEFAAGIAKVIQQNMLNEAALRRFYAEKKDSLYTLCKERLAAENYSFIDDFFSDEARIAAAVDGLRDCIKTSHTEFADYIDKYITGRIEAGGTENFTESLKEILFEKIKSGGPAAYTGKKIQERINDKNLPEHITSKISEALLDLFHQYLRQNLQNIFDPKTLRRHETAFTGYIESHTLSGLTGKETAAEIAGLLPRKAPALIAKLAGGRMTDGRRRLKDCLSGGIPALIKSKGSLVNRAICRLAASQKSAIVSKIMDEAGGGSFLDRLVKQAANALMRDDVEAIIGIVIDEKLFPFLEARRDAVFGILDDTLESPLVFDSKVFNRENTETVLSRLFASEQAIKALTNLSGSYLNSLAGLKLKTLLSPLNMDTIDGFLGNIAPMLNSAASQLTIRLDDRAAVKRLNELFKRLISKIFDGTPAYTALRGIDIEAEAARISTQFFNDGAAVETTKLILGGLLRKILDDKDFYDHALFRRDISFFLLNCVNVDEAAAPRVRLRTLLAGLLRGTGAVISPSAKNSICGDYILPAMLDSGGKQFPSLVNSLSLYSVVEREINGMHPAEIENVFYGFAGPYFKKIILYGWIGLFGGLLSYALACLLPFPP